MQPSQFYQFYSQQNGSFDSEDEGRRSRPSTAPSTPRMNQRNNNAQPQPPPLSTAPQAPPLSNIPTTFNIADAATGEPSFLYINTFILLKIKNVFHWNIKAFRLTLSSEYFNEIHFWFLIKLWRTDYRIPVLCTYITYVCNVHFRFEKLRWIMATKPRYCFWINSWIVRNFEIDNKRACYFTINKTMQWILKLTTSTVFILRSIK